MGLLQFRKFYNTLSKVSLLKNIMKYLFEQLYLKMIQFSVSHEILALIYTFGYVTIK